MAPAHSWEHPSRAWENIFEHSWERDLDVNPYDDHDNLTRETAGERFFEYIVDLKVQGTLSATQACVLCYYAQKAGVVGNAQ